MLLREGTCSDIVCCSLESHGDGELEHWALVTVYIEGMGFYAHNNQIAGETNIEYLHNVKCCAKSFICIISFNADN